MDTLRWGEYSGVEIYNWDVYILGIMSHTVAECLGKKKDMFIFWLFTPLVAVATF